MALNIPEQKHNQAVISAKNNTVVLQGEIDQNKPEIFLEPFFNEVNKQMEDQVIIDLLELNFFNSAAIGCLIDFLINRRPGSLVTMKIDKSRFWQKILMDVVQSIDKDSIRIET